MVFVRKEGTSTVREHMLDILQRLSRLREALGEDAFEKACRRARHAIAAVALEEAERDRPSHSGKS
jgi:hypothetical protein